MLYGLEQKRLGDNGIWAGEEMDYPRWLSVSASNNYVDGGTI